MVSKELQTELVDVTGARPAPFEQRQLEELNKARGALRLKSELLSILSQEVRTPLAGIAGMAAMLAETSLTDQQREFLNTIRSSSDVLMTVMNDIGDLNKIDEQKLKLEPVDFDLASIVAEAAELAGELAAQKGLKLTHSLDADVPVDLSGDPARLKQILVTLLSNVCRLIEAGSVRLLVSLESGPDGGSAAMPIRLKFEFAESGAAIPYENARLLRQSFSRAGIPMTESFDWPAVGLAICNRLANLMGGEIGLSGAPGPGTIFWFRARFSLPSADAAPENAKGFSAGVEAAPTAVETEASSAVVKSPSAPDRSGTAASILLVEDNLVNQMVASLCLQKLGYAVQIAEDGCAALDAFASKRFDLILMDCHMPRMDGATATQKIRELGGYGKKIPILALTADVFQTERDRCIAAGMNDFLSKPIAAELLKNKIEFWLEQGD